MIKVQESLPFFISKFTNKHDRIVIKSALNNVGVDLNNLKYDDLTGVKSSDPRLRGIGGALFYVIGDNCVAYINKEWIYSSWRFSKDVDGINNSEEFCRLPIKKKVEISDEVYFVPYIYDQGVKDKRTQRKDSKSGSLDRYTAQTRPRYTAIDKSGYVIDPGKYKRMFAEMNINNTNKILNDLANIYSDLALALPNIDRDDYRLMSDYSSIMSRIPGEFRSLDTVLRDYNEHKDYGEDHIKKAEYDYYRRSLIRCISDIRDLTIKGKKILSRI